VLLAPEYILDEIAAPVHRRSLASLLATSSNNHNHKINVQIQTAVQSLHYLLENNLISNKQYGFITGRSIMLQLLHMLGDWTG